VSRSSFAVTPVHDAFGCANFVCLVLALSASACSRCSSELEPAPASVTPSATPSARAAQRPVEPPPEPLPPPVTPKVPPELVACGERVIYRITEKSLDVIETAAELPPPQIRGSRVARQTAELGVDEPLNVVSTAKTGAIVIAKGGVFSYELGQTRARRFAPIPTNGPLVVWANRRSAESFHVLAVGDEVVREYSIAGRPSSDAGAPKGPAKPRRVTNLPEFDGRLFTMLADGTPMYSTQKGLVRLGDEPRTAAFSDVSPRAAILFADPSPDRFWLANAAGKLDLWDRKQSASPTLSSAVPGVVIDAAQEGERVAVLGIELNDQGYQPTVTIFSNGKQQGRLNVGLSIGLRAQPKLDLCLVPGRPWVAVGGTQWLQLLDWETRRLLAEW
jgi:hypothetical protein